MGWKEDFRALIEERIGIIVREDQQTSVLTRFISSRVRALKQKDPQDYVDHLKQQPTTSWEFARLIEVLTNGQTSFFRSIEQFKIIEKIFLSNKEIGRQLMVWSTACATGEEPYTLAMLAIETDVNVHILATDINQEHLRAAKSRLYNEWSMRNIPPDFRQRFFTKRDDAFEIIDAVARQVHFRRLNIASDQLPTPPGKPYKWDMILCRNMFIYFSPKVIQYVAEDLLKVLSADGLLFLSPSESLHGYHLPLQVVQFENNSFAYKRLRSKDTASFPRPPIFKLVVPALQRKSAEYSTLAKSASQSKVADPYQEALTKIESKNYDEAQQLLETHVSEHPHRVQCWLVLGNLYTRNRQFLLALESFEKAQDLEPLLPDVHFFPGLIYRKQNNLERAKQTFRRVLFLNPEFWPASFLLGGTYGRLGDEEGKLREYNRTVTILEKTPHSNPFTVPPVATDLEDDLFPDRVLEMCRSFIRAH